MHANVRAVARPPFSSDKLYSSPAMTILLWILQPLLALHTAMGAIWKFSHPAQTVPSLKALSPGVWHGMGVTELVCSAALILALFIKSWGQLASLGAAVIAAEMLLFSALYVRSGDRQLGHLIYWLIVAAICVCIAYGRWTAKPI
jgi:hypothetical protein